MTKSDLNSGAIELGSAEKSILNVSCRLIYAVMMMARESRHAKLIPMKIERRLIASIFTSACSRMIFSLILSSVSYAI